jgi:metal-responsive CopG/Arc/MetJ family transcriptional regulator
MRVHITLPESVVRELDRRVGRRRRSAFIGRAVKHALESEQRRELVESAIGTIGASGHDWDADPANWVRQQRRLDERRLG